MPEAESAYSPREEDVAFFQREVASFVPARVFDAHVHMWRDNADWASKANLPGTVGHAEYLRFIDWLHPGRRVGALVLSFGVKPEEIEVSNRWVSQEVARDPLFRGEFFVRPGDDPEWVRQETRRLRLHGLKCYHLQASVTPTWEADIPAYLPEPLVKVAHEEGWVITLHIVKSRSLADPGNIHWIRHYCKTYPNMKLILAHSARGFQPAHNLEGLPHLKGLDNLWFDSSANCDAMAHQSILRIIGPQRFMYGSDFMISHMRGRPVPIADTFIWLNEKSPVWGEKHTQVKPVLVGLEHLRSLKWACWSERIKDSEIEDIFWNNAARLFNLKSE